MVDVMRQEMLTLKEVAEHLRVNYHTVRNWTLRETGPRLDFVRAGGRIRTSVEAVERFLGLEQADHRQFETNRSRKQRQSEREEFEKELAR